MPVKKTAKAKLSVAERAYLKFLDRGGEHGHDMEDWLAAENEAKSEKPSAKQKVIAKSRVKKSK
jgi:hypothetical protein